MYSCSRRYKDACETGKTEYAASYRTLLMFVKLKQKEINLSQKLRECSIEDVYIYGAGDICSLLIDELRGGDVRIHGIIEDNEARYRTLYPKIPMFGSNSKDIEKNYTIIVSYPNRYNDIAERLCEIGFDINRIINLEEVLAFCIIK